MKDPNKHIIDTTLRDGEQAPGIVFSLEEKIKIAKLLDQAGVDEISVGTPVMGEQEIKGIQEILKLGLNAKILGWTRCHPKDFNAAMKANLSRIHVSFVTSPILMEVFSETELTIIKKIKNTIKDLKKYFDFVSVGFQDIARTKLTSLKTFIGYALCGGASRIRLADTLGMMHPLQVETFIRNIIESYPHVDFEFHGHNDLGMASANTITAVLSGAKSISATVNGLGERAGNASLEEVAVSIERSTPYKTNIKLPLLYELSKVVSLACGEENHSQKPIVGRRVFVHESGIHAQGISSKEESYQGLSPDSVGNPFRGITFGKHSGLHGLKSFLNKNYVFLSDERARELLIKIKEKSNKIKGAVPHYEVLDMARYHKKKSLALKFQLA